MKFVCQLDYAHIPYHTNVSKDIPEEKKLRTVRLSGCGLCCTCMAIDYLTDTTLDIEECVRISESVVANHSTGTDMNVLAPHIAEKFELAYSKTSDLDEAVRHLQCGGVAIAHVGVPTGKEIGLFTKGGHYILLISTDGKDFCILDPSYSAEKFTIPERAGKIDESNAPYLYADIHTVDGEAKPGRVKYHLFARKRK